MGASVDPLVVGRVIGDVIDLFIPSVSMSVHYGSKHVNNGCDVKPSSAITPPRVAIAGHPDQLFTLVMTDPDAPSPSDPTQREWVHWIVTDIPGYSPDAQRGKEVVEYAGPVPAIGIHRYVFVLFMQKCRLEGRVQVQEPVQRSNFCTRAFAQAFDLGLPVATVYFNAHKEPKNSRTKRH